MRVRRRTLVLVWIAINALLPLVFLWLWALGVSWADDPEWVVVGFVHFSIACLSIPGLIE